MFFYLNKGNQSVMIICHFCHTGNNRCIVDNGGCSGLCLPIGFGRSCACEDGMNLQDDYRTCEEGKKTIAYRADRKTCCLSFVRVLDSHFHHFLPLFLFKPSELYMVRWCFKTNLTLFFLQCCNNCFCNIFVKIIIQSPILY